MVELLKNSYRGRHILKSMIVKDLRARYVGSLLGPLWNVLTPLYYLFLYTLIFSTILNVRFSQAGGTSSFVLYLLAGLIPWLFFQEAVTRGSGIFLENGHIIKTVKFPIEVCVVMVLLSSLVSFLIYIFLYFGYLLAVGALRPLALPLVVIPFLMQVLLIMGISFGLGSVAVFFRDLKQVIPLILNAFFFLTPIVYPADIIPENVRWLFSLNPFYWITEIYRSIIIDGTLPAWKYFLYPGVLSVVVYFIGFRVFEKTREAFKDIL
jgi:ABC-type polysaccharide/polyol phosphate export permease